MERTPITVMVFLVILITPPLPRVRNGCFICHSDCQTYDFSLEPDNFNSKAGNTDALFSEFWENVGQIRSGNIMFYGIFHDTIVGFGSDGIRLWNHDMERPTFFRFENSEPVKPEGLNETCHTTNFLLGSRGAFVHVRSFMAIVYRGLWPGIGLVHQATADGFRIILEMDSGARPSEANFRCDDGDAQGLGQGHLSFHGYEESVNRILRTCRQPEDCGFRSACVPSGLIGRSTEQALGDSLGLGPLYYSTYVGGSDRDIANSLVVDGSGNTYVTGWTSSLDFPADGPYGPPNGSTDDCFVLKLNSTGNGLVYSTFVGGSDTDRATSIAVDPSGNAYVCGFTFSDDFPVVNPYDATLGLAESPDCFIFKLNVSGESLMYSTYLGGPGSDIGSSLALDSSSCIYMTGSTDSSDFPAASSPDCSHNEGDSDVFVLALNLSENVLLFSTCLGGSGLDAGTSVSLGSSGMLFVTGTTYSADFPTTSHYDETYNGESDCFVLQMDPLGHLLTSTFVGGSGSESGSSVVVDCNGSAYVTGYTTSVDFPTTASAYDTVLGGGQDIFVFKLQTDFKGLSYSTLVGGSNTDSGESIAVDSWGYAYITGSTRSSDFPLLAAVRSSYEGGEDCFVLKLDTTGSKLLFSTYLGGSENEAGTALVVDSAGNAYVAGYTSSLDYPTENALDGEFNGGLSDCIIVKLADNGDSDEDGLSDYVENRLGTCRFDNDSDDDSLSDGDEVLVYNTNPTNADSDDDGMPDGWEVEHGLNPLVYDAESDLDLDGLDNLHEYLYGTDPQKEDSDGDTIPDGWEVTYGFDPLSPSVPLAELLVYNMPAVLLLSGLASTVAVLAILRMRAKEQGRISQAEKAAQETYRAIEQLATDSSDNHDELDG